MSADGLATYGEEQQERVGFFTDTSVCIGCKACEVACKEWNLIPEDGFDWTGEVYDNTGSCRREHVASRRVHRAGEAAATRRATRGTALRWLMESDVCKHCTHAACLDVCPTGALFRTEFGTVVVQQDICNGCGYCVPACPFGVLDKRHLAPAPDLPAFATRTAASGSAPSATTGSRAVTSRRARRRAPRNRSSSARSTSCGYTPTTGSQKLEADGWNGAQLYGRDPGDGVGGFGAFFLLLDEPEVYGLPPDPVVTTRDLPEMWTNMLVAAGALVFGVAAAFLGGRS